MINKIHFSILPMWLVLLFSLESCAQTNYKSENIVLVTLDGYRWQELFYGIDSALLSSEFTSKKNELEKRFWAKSREERALLLNPFFQGKVASNGVLLGDRNNGSKVNCTNSMWFSYPGYNEILTGSADDSRINSNQKINNPNKTFLEILNSKSEYKGDVAAFGSWDVFPYIINEKRSGVYVNAGFEPANHKELSETEIFLNQFQKEASSPWNGVRLDAFTHHYALEYMREWEPNIVYIAYGETDDFAHDGDYTKYIESAYKTNQFLIELWNFIQNSDFYANNTTMIITTDHGRGTLPLETWKSHGAKVPDAGEIWIGAIGPDIKTGKEIKGQFYQSQVTPTIMELLQENQNLKSKPIYEIIR